MFGEGEKIARLTIKNDILSFATGNKNKFIEAKEILERFNIKIQRIVKAEEIQDNDLRKIAIHSLLKTLESVQTHVIVEDAGLFVESLNGYPGPYSSYVYKKLGVGGILELLNGQINRNAEFRSIIAFGIPGRERSSITTFWGVIKGRIDSQSRGLGFGFDPIFVPNNENATFGEMSISYKNRLSHRSKSLTKFAKWYLQQKF